MINETEVVDWVDCCDDDWSVWLRFETWIWAALLLVHLSMVAFLVVHGRKDKTFRQAFYLFFVAVTLVDCALALLRSSQIGWGSTIFGTNYDDPKIYQKEPWTDELLDYATIRGTLNMIVEHMVVPVLGHAQQLFLVATAVNRFTAFAFPLKHASMWRTRTVVAGMILLTVASVLLGAAWPIVSAIRQLVECSTVTGKERRELRCGTHNWALQYKKFLGRTLIIFTSTIYCVVSFILNLGSVAMLNVLRTTGRLQRKGPELQLFAHSLWMFLLQLLMAFQDIVRMVDYPEQYFSELGLEFTWANWAKSSEWLAGMNATRKWIKGELDLTPGCVSWTGYFHNNKEVPLCSAWYRVLIGELLLRADPDFTVHAFEQCLFTLSGSFFLLLIRWVGTD